MVVEVGWTTFDADLPDPLRPSLEDRFRRRIEAHVGLPVASP